MAYHQTPEHKEKVRLALEKRKEVNLYQDRKLEGVVEAKVSKLFDEAGVREYEAWFYLTVHAEGKDPRFYEKWPSPQQQAITEIRKDGAELVFLDTTSEPLIKAYEYEGEVEGLMTVVILEKVKKEGEVRYWIETEDERAKRAGIDIRAERRKSK